MYMYKGPHRETPPPEVRSSNSIAVNMLSFVYLENDYL